MNPARVNSLCISMNQGKTVLKKEDPKYYRGKLRPEILEFDEVFYVTIEGSGEPGGEMFQKGTNELFTLAYQIKFSSRAAGRDFTVSNLETLWWTESGEFDPEKKPEEWRWKVMIRLPDFVGPEDVENAKKEAMQKKNLPDLEKAEYEIMKEGKCVQVMHIGPYDEEGRTYNLLMEFVDQNGLKLNGLFHEIYLSDPSRTSPENLKTIIRLPVRQEKRENDQP